MSGPDVAAATEFVWRHARVHDRHRFAHEFLEGSADAVVTALAAYQNPDGGFGNALEPDCRAPVSQPIATSMALAMLGEVGRLDTEQEIVRAALRWCESASTDEGALPFCLPDVADYPRAPWWNPEGDPPPPNLNPTAGVVGWFREAGVEADWVDRAERWCWDEVDRLHRFSQYQVEELAVLVTRAGDADRASAVTDRLRDVLAAGEVVPLDPDAPSEGGGDAHTPLHMAPRPDAVLGTAFDNGVIEAFLDRLVDDQADDGGWSIGWPAPGPAAVAEWRAIVTIEALAVLRAYGRFPT